MDLERLQYRGFTPRQEVEQDAEKMVTGLLTETPIEGSVKVVIADRGDHFYISAVGNARKKLFNSDSIHPKADMHGWPRTWQLNALAKVMTDLLQQIKRTFGLAGPPSEDSVKKGTSP